MRLVENGFHSFEKAINLYKDLPTCQPEKYDYVLKDIVCRSTTKTPTSTPKKETVSKPDPKLTAVVYYKNCDAVRMAGQILSMRESQGTAESSIETVMELDVKDN